jgi:hypothetical protein
VILVLFVYFGGKYCPSVLKKNKELLLGVAVGLVLCSFMGLRLEGFKTEGECVEACKDPEAVTMVAKAEGKAVVETKPFLKPLPLLPQAAPFKPSLKRVEKKSGGN